MTTEQSLESNRPIPIFMAGLPGKMATLVAETVNASDYFNLIPTAMTSKSHKFTYMQVGNQMVHLVDYCQDNLERGRIVVDFTTPDAILLNTIVYTSLRLPFVMGTSGGNREQMEEIVRKSRTSAVIAANMDPQIIRRQMDIDEFAENNPGVFEGAVVDITESHQSTKRDVSGTALAFRAQFESYGALPNGNITSIRNTESQIAMGITDPESGHAYHWVDVKNPDGETIYNFTTAIRGRLSYVAGTLMAVRFLRRQICAGSEGQVFSMRDVIAGGDN